MKISFAECYKNPKSRHEETDEPTIRLGLHNTGFPFLLRKEYLIIGEMRDPLDLSIPAPRALLSSDSLTTSWF